MAIEYTTTATFSAVVMLVAYKQLSPLVGGPTPAALGWFSPAAALFAATGTYLFLFKLCMHFYKATLWRHVNADKYVDGEWDYRFSQQSLVGVSEDPKNDDQSDRPVPRWGRLSEGEGCARIKHTMDELLLHGETDSMSIASSKDRPTPQEASPSRSDLYVDRQMTTLVTSLKSVAMDFWEDRLHIAGLITSDAGTATIFMNLNVISNPERRLGILPTPPRAMRGFYYVASEGRMPPRYGILELERRTQAKQAKTASVSRAPDTR